MIIEDEYIVVWGHGADQRVSQRVPESDLQSFLRVLIFNGVSWFDCRRVTHA